MEEQHHSFEAISSSLPTPRIFPFPLTPPPFSPLISVHCLANQGKTVLFGTEAGTTGSLESEMYYHGICVLADHRTCRAQDAKEKNFNQLTSRGQAWKSAQLDSIPCPWGRPCLNVACFPWSPLPSGQLRGFWLGSQFYQN